MLHFVCLLLKSEAIPIYIKVALARPCKGRGCAQTSLSDLRVLSEWSLDERNEGEEGRERGGIVEEDRN